MVENTKFTLKVSNLSAAEYDDLRVLLHQNSLAVEDDAYRDPHSAWQVITITVQYAWDHKEQIGTALSIGKVLYDWVQKFRAERAAREAQASAQKALPPSIVIARPGDLVGLDLINDDKVKVQDYIAHHPRAKDPNSIGR